MIDENIFCLIRSQEGQTAEQIRKALGLSRFTVPPALRRMESMRWIRLCDDLETYVVYDR